MKYEQASSHEFAGDDILETVEYGIDPENMGMAIAMLTEYSDIRGSIVREVTSNCEDAALEVLDIQQLPFDKLVASYPNFAQYNPQQFEALRAYFVAKGPRKNTIVHIDSTYGSYTISFKDFGIGLSPQRVKQVYAKYLASTKRKTNTQIGAFGLGSKTPLGYTDMFEMRTVFLGIAYEYVIHKGDKAPKLELIDKYQTDEENQTEVVVGIDNAIDLKAFKHAVQTQLAYFDNIEYINCEVPNDYRIYKGRHFAYRTHNRFSYIHLCLGKVYYPINFEQLGLNQHQYDIPIALYFPLDEMDKIDIMWHREQLKYSDKTIEAITTKLAQAYEELKLLVATRSSEASDIQDYYVRKNEFKGKNVELFDNVIIKNLSKIAPVIFRPPAEFRDIKKLPEHPLSIVYKVRNQIDYLGKEERVISRRVEDHGKIFRPSTYDPSYTPSRVLLMRDGEKVSALKNRYIAEAYFPRRSQFQIISQNKVDLSTDESKYELAAMFGYSYDQLAEVPWKQIAAYYREIIKLVRKNFEYYNDIETDLDWDKARKEKDKEERDQKNQRVTLRRLEVNYDYGARYKDTRDEKYIFKISQYDGKFFKDYTGLLIYGTAKDSDKLKMAADILFSNVFFVDDVATRKLDYKKIILTKVAVNNIKWVTNALNAMHVDEFLLMRRNASIIRRKMTAYKINNLLPKNKYDLLTNNVFGVVAPEIHMVATHLTQYVNNYNSSSSYISDASGSISVSDDLIELFNDYESQRQRLIARMKTKGLPIPRTYPLYDTFWIGQAKLLADYLDKYKMLSYIDTRYIPEDILQEYLEQDPIHYTLLRRFKQWKNATQRKSTD